MSSMKYAPLAVIALLGTASAGAMSSQPLSGSLARLSPADFAGRVTVEDDNRAQVVTLSTRRASMREGPSREVFVDDAHARAVLDRKADRVSFQVWHEFSYNGNMSDIVAIHYPAGGERHRAAPQGLEQWQSNCGSTDWGGNCFLSTRIGFALPLEHVRAIAAGHVPHSREPWPVQFEDRAGKVFTVGFAPAELAGMVQAYEAWKSRQQAR